MLDRLPHLGIVESLEGRALFIVAGLATFRVGLGNHPRLSGPLLVFFDMELEINATRTMAGLTLNAGQLRFDLLENRIAGDMAGQSLGIFLLGSL